MQSFVAMVFPPVKIKILRKRNVSGIINCMGRSCMCMTRKIKIKNLAPLSI